MIKKNYKYMNLSNDMYYEVFKYLSFKEILKLSEVNKKLKELIENNKIGLIHKFDELCDFSRFKNIRSLNINLMNFTDEYLIIILKNNNQLKNIDLSSTSITDKGLNILGETNFNINSLILYNIQNKITDKGCNKLFKNNNNIEIINIAWSNISDISLINLIYNNNKLKDIDLSYTKISEIGILYLLNINFKFLKINGIKISDETKKKLNNYRSKRLISY